MKNEIKKRKVRKINWDTPRWERLANELARSRTIIKPCRECGYPVVDGYCCNTCGSNNP